MRSNFSYPKAAYMPKLNLSCATIWEITGWGWGGGGWGWGKGQNDGLNCYAKWLGRPRVNLRL